MSMWICICHRASACERRALVFTHILREASTRLLVLLRWAMRRPQIAERAKVRLSRFFINRPTVSHGPYPKGMKISSIISAGLSSVTFCSILCQIGLVGLLASCGTPTKTIALSCQERQIEIYVDDEYLGRDLVYYTVPKGREYIEVSCRDNGVEVYSRRYYVSGKEGKLIELQIPKNYKYSSKPY